MQFFLTTPSFPPPRPLQCPAWPRLCARAAALRPSPSGGARRRSAVRGMLPVRLGDVSPGRSVAPSPPWRRLCFVSLDSALLPCLSRSIFVFQWSSHFRFPSSVLQSCAICDQCALLCCTVDFLCGFFGAVRCMFFILCAHCLPEFSAPSRSVAPVVAHSLVLHNGPLPSITHSSTDWGVR